MKRDLNRMLWRHGRVILTIASVLYSCIQLQSAVNVGDSLESVIAEKGEPLGRMKAGNITVLQYSDISITLVDGTVSQTMAREAHSVAVSEPTARTPTVTRRRIVQTSPGKRPSRRTNGDEHIPATTKVEWTSNYDEALKRARLEKRKTLLFFTGSDWCGWCKRLVKEVFESAEFAHYASSNLVLVELDFPRREQLPRETARQNDRLAKLYRIRGYPTVIVLDSDARQIGELGYKLGGPRPFISALRDL